MNLTNNLSVSSKTKYYFIVSSNPSSKVFLILNDMIHFIEWIIWLTCIFIDTKENSILCIYYSLDKLLIFDYSEWRILNFTTFILNSYLINSSINVCKDACQILSIINASKELLQLIHGVNDIGCVLITHDGCYFLCKKSYL